MSPFIVAKVLENLVGFSYKAKKLHSEDLLVEVNTKKQSEALLRLTNIVDVEVSVSPHRTLNTVRGVLSEEAFLYTSEDELLEGLKSSGVVDVRRIVFRKNGENIPSKHVILTFERRALPETVKAGYLNCRIRPYIPNPQRCFRCQRFGHGSRSCRGKETCAKCGNEGHVSDGCEAEAHCANCRGPHPAYYRSCPLWKQEKDILAVKVKENLSYADAKKRFSFLSKGGYAEVVRRGPAPRSETKATQVSPEILVADLKAPSPQQRQHAAPLGKDGPAIAVPALPFKTVARGNEAADRAARTCVSREVDIKGIPYVDYRSSVRCLQRAPMEASSRGLSKEEDSSGESTAITLLPHGKSTDTTATNLCFEGTIGCTRGSCAVTSQYTSLYRDSTTASVIFDYQVSWDTERLRGTSALLSECIKACHLDNYFSGQVGGSEAEMSNKLFLLFVQITLLPRGKSTDTTATNLCFEGTIGCTRGSCAVTSQYTSPYRDSTTASVIFDYQVSWDTERLRGTSALLSECIKACHLDNYFSGQVGGSEAEMSNKLFLLFVQWGHWGQRKKTPILRREPPRRIWAHSRPWAPHASPTAAPGGSTAVTAHQVYSDQRCGVAGPDQGGPSPALKWMLVSQHPPWAWDPVALAPPLWV
ncbi:hypothetical protein ISCGN_007011 [Ixodes scapularis]